MLDLYQDWQHNDSHHMLLLLLNRLNMNTDTKSADQLSSYENIIFSNKEWWILIFLFLFSIIGVFLCTSQNDMIEKDYIEMSLN